MSGDLAWLCECKGSRNHLEGWQKWSGQQRTTWKKTLKVIWLKKICLVFKGLGEFCNSKGLVNFWNFHSSVEQSHYFVVCHVRLPALCLFKQSREILWMQRIPRFSLISNMMNGKGVLKLAHFIFKSYIHKAILSSVYVNWSHDQLMVTN